MLVSGLMLAVKLEPVPTAIEYSGARVLSSGVILSRQGPVPLTTSTV
jgi:hypothetical protein